MLTLKEFQNNQHSMPEELKKQFWDDFLKFKQKMPKAIQAFHAEGIEAHKTNGTFPRRKWEDVAALLDKSFYAENLTLMWEFSEPRIFSDDKAKVSGVLYVTCGIYTEAVAEASQLFVYTSKDEMAIGKAYRLLWKGMLMWLTGAGDGSEQALDEVITEGEMVQGKSRITSVAGINLQEYWLTQKESLSQDFRVEPSQIGQMAADITKGQFPETKAGIDLLVKRLALALKKGLTQNEQPSE